MIKETHDSTEILNFKPSSCVRDEREILFAIEGFDQFFFFFFFWRRKREDACIFFFFFNYLISIKIDSCVIILMGNLRKLLSENC